MQCLPRSSLTPSLTQEALVLHLCAPRGPCLPCVPCSLLGLSSFLRRLSRFGSNPCFVAPAGKHRAQTKSVMQLVASAAASYHVLASRYRQGSQECVCIEAHMLPLSPFYCPPWPARSEVGGRGASRVWMVYSGIGDLGPRDLQEAAVLSSHGVSKYLA